VPEPPNKVKLGEAPDVEMTCLTSPCVYVASILMSSPGPVGMFLICNAVDTAQPHLVEG
jgi:hypothetical protein